MSVRGGTYMTRKQSEQLLAAVIIARSTSYIFSKMAMNSLQPFNLLAVRFLLAVSILVILFHKKLRTIDRNTFVGGAIMGSIFTLVMTMEMFGLRKTDTATTSFIENSAVAFVPILEGILLRKFPEKRTIISVVLALTGIGFLTLGKSGGLLRPGCLYLLMAVLFYAAAIITTGYFSKKYDPLLLGIVQVGTMGVWTLLASLLTEQTRLPQTGAEWEMIGTLAVVGSCFGFTLQPVAQRGTTAEVAGMMCAINPMSASILGALVLHEQMTSSKLLGCLLIMGGLLVHFARREKKTTVKPVSYNLHTTK